MRGEGRDAVLDDLRRVAELVFGDDERRREANDVIVRGFGEEAFPPTSLFRDSRFVLDSYL